MQTETETRLVAVHSKRTRELRLRFEEACQQMFEGADIEHRAEMICDGRGWIVDDGVVNAYGQPFPARGRVEGKAREMLGPVFRRVGKRLETALDGLEPNPDATVSRARYSELRTALAELAANSACVKRYGDLIRDPETGNVREAGYLTPDIYDAERVQPFLDEAAECWIRFVVSWAEFLASDAEWRGLTAAPEMVEREVSVHGW